MGGWATIRPGGWRRESGAVQEDRSVDMPLDGALA